MHNNSNNNNNNTHTHTHHDVDDSEVFLESMTNKLDPSLQQVDQLEVAGLECGQVLRAHCGIKISRLDA